MTEERLTQAEYARRRGVSKEAVRQAVVAGRITLIRGKIDPEQADQEWQDNTDHDMRKNGKRVAAGTGLARHKADHEGWKARTAELEYRRRAGELVDRAKVEREVFEANRRARDRLRLIVSRIGALLTPEAREMLRKEIRDACSELSG